jgi:protein-S-isoprenylcysteine O-methyltransferase Ste14
MKILRHLQAIVLLPLLVTGVIPWLILAGSAGLPGGWSLPPPLTLVPVTAGGLLIGLGLTLVVATVRLFFQYGEGTLAPWTPTQQLVVRGPYRHVRNPMISGVCALLLGEALVFGAVNLLYWFGAVLLLNLIYLPLVEEPDLAQRFGADYLRYKQHVPRWIPRARPWHGSWEHKEELL